MKIHTVRGGGGVDLHVREWGSQSARPILFIHGWSQNHLCWMKQFESELQDEFRLLALDLRGHGMSGAPSEAEQYTDSEKWADDIAAVLGRLALDAPVLVGWSYGGFVIGDYLRKYGETRLGGINFVSGALVLGPKAYGKLIGPGFLENAPHCCESDVPTNIAATRRFLRACSARPIGQEEFEIALAYTMLVTPHVRSALLQRELDYARDLAKLSIPVLVTQGRSDTLVLPAMSDYIATHCRTARQSWYDDVGHIPFLEDAKRFNSELAEFAG
jgi:non-heme chloroperoxidase